MADPFDAFPREPWMEDGSCRGDDNPDDWYSLPVDPNTYSPATERAKAVCLTCPVRNECLSYALEHDERQGVWGALTPHERNRIA